MHPTSFKQTIIHTLSKSPYLSIYLVHNIHYCHIALVNQPGNRLIFFLINETVQFYFVAFRFPPTQINYFTFLLYRIRWIVFIFFNPTPSSTSIDFFRSLCRVPSILLTLNYLPWRSGCWKTELGWRRVTNRTVLEIVYRVSLNLLHYLFKIGWGLWLIGLSILL